MRSQYPFLDPDSSTGTGGRDNACDAGDDGRQDAAGRAAGADYEETYLDWPPRRRKVGPDEGERHAGALRRLRRLRR